jgi:hypothetical protein
VNFAVGSSHEGTTSLRDVAIKFVRNGLGEVTVRRDECDGNFRALVLVLIGRLGDGDVEFVAEPVFERTDDGPFFF